MCIFDGYSTKKLVDEMVIGQKRFKSFFGNQERLTKNLKAYKEAVSGLARMINEEFSKLSILKKTLQIRDYNLLLRKTASYPKCFPLLEFLFKHKNVLNIDIESAGKKSGTALDIAKKFKNHQAVELLDKTFEVKKTATSFV
jgi:hypothetical protein